MIKSLYKFFSPRYQSLFLEYPVQFKPRYGHGKAPHQLLYNIVNENREIYNHFLSDFLKSASFIHQIKKCKDNIEDTLPCWNNHFLPGLDIIALYGMVQYFQPKHYVEIGSGNSTKVAVKSMKDHKLNTKITSIDPAPRREIDSMVDHIIRSPFENIDYDFLFNLEKNDILFIDNSHRVLPNSDATVFFLEVLPQLQSGVIVHLHDIYLPYDYPQFMCDRFYSEQYVLAAFLLANSKKYKVLLPNYFISEDSELSASIAPIWKHPNLEDVERHGGSFWLQIV